ncbi:hypothetical protein [Orbus mooreae]|uniref:hypothetical protein n=1 Tax=Orbus mooreae TaxID=3074107 RepID=UPI00370D89CB
MNKNEWYKKRILWKANQFKSLSQTMLRSEKDDVSFEKLCEKHMNSDDEILFLFSDKEYIKWTAITTDKIISYHDNNVYQEKLDNIKKLIEIRKDDISNNNLKYCASFLLVGEGKLPIWTPNSQILFALMNILRMFPLKENV